MNANRFLFLLGFLLFPLLLSTIKCNDAQQTAKTQNEASIQTLTEKKAVVEGYKTTAVNAMNQMTPDGNKVNSAFDKASAAVTAITAVKNSITEKLAAIRTLATEAKAAKANKETAKAKLNEATTKLTELKTAAEGLNASKQQLTAAQAETNEGYTSAKEQLQLMREEQKKTNAVLADINGITFNTEDTDDATEGNPRKNGIDGLKNDINAFKTFIDEHVNEKLEKLNEISEKNNEVYKKILEANQEFSEIQGLVSQADTAVNDATQTVNEASSAAGGASSDGHLFVRGDAFNHESLLADDKKCSTDDKTKAACKTHSNCYKVDGKPVCMCHPGYSPRDGQTADCVKNASMTCQSGSHNCHQNATCKLDNQLGIGCKCKPEFKGDGIFCSNSLKSMLNIIFVLAVASVQLLF